MSTSKAIKQAEITDVKTGASEEDAPLTGATGSFQVPDFNRDRQLYAIASRSAGRLNAASITPEEIASLLKERHSLLDKVFTGVASKKESNRLEYVRWSLDRIEDAQTGEMLDRLEGYLMQYENLLANIQNLQHQIDQRLQKKK